MRFAPGSICHASALAHEDYAQVASDAARWRCDGDVFDWEKPRHFVRHDLRARGPATPEPRYLEFERHPLKSLTLTAFATDGEIKIRRYEKEAIPLGASSLRSITALPDTDAPIYAIVAKIDGGMFPEVLRSADLRAKPSVNIVAGLPHLIAALICGLLIAPMLFDLGYWRALREPFPLFHALFCVMACIQTAAVSGLIPLFTAVDFDIEMLITYLSLDAMIAANILFAYHFVERRSLRLGQRRILGALVGITAINGVATTLWAAQIGFYVDHIYLGTLLSVLAAYFYVLFRSWQRGSRAAPYLFLGLAPFTLVTLGQFATVIFAGAKIEFDETWPQNLALLFEVVATALAVADRFILVRRERDKALDKARILGALSERDDLTAMLNRRALDAHYPSLLADGFTTLALIDLDHFKSVNDAYGHPIGDAVLRGVAAALSDGSDRDLRAFRIGGEEFLLLLRGANAEQRAEQRRRAITPRIASEVPALDRPLTASMGLVDFSALSGDAASDFAALYSRADWLLYEAKRKGRNRSQSEAFTGSEPERKRPSDWSPRADAA